MKHTVMIAGLLVTATLLGGCGARANMNEAGTARALASGHTDMRAYTEINFSTGLEGEMVRRTGAPAARVLQLGNIYYTALAPDQDMAAANDPHQLDVMAQALRDILGLRVLEVHASTDPDAYEMLNKLFTRAGNGETLTAGEIQSFAREWEQRAHQLQ